MVRGYFIIQIKIVLTGEKNLSVERAAADAKENLQIFFFIISPFQKDQVSI